MSESFLKVNTKIHPLSSESTFVSIFPLLFLLSIYLSIHLFFFFFLDAFQSELQTSIPSLILNFNHSPVSSVHTHTSPEPFSWLLCTEIWSHFPYLDTASNPNTSRICCLHRRPFTKLYPDSIYPDYGIYSTHRILKPERKLSDLGSPTPMFPGIKQVA